MKPYFHYIINNKEIKQLFSKSKLLFLFPLPNRGFIRNHEDSKSWARVSELPFKRGFLAIGPKRTQRELKRALKRGLKGEISRASTRESTR